MIVKRRATQSVGGCLGNIEVFFDTIVGTIENYFVPGFYVQDTILYTDVLQV